jgi:hypothetical protein
MQESKVERGRNHTSARKWPCGATYQTTSLRILALGISWPPSAIGFIPSLELGEFILWNHIGVCQHLKLLDEHFWL